MKKTIAGITAAAALVVGGVFLSSQSTPPTGVVTPATWVKSAGRKLYDTPSGALDTGFYIVNFDSSITAHLAAIMTATTTQPDGLYPVKDTTGLIQAHERGTRYTDEFSDGSTFTRDDVDLSKKTFVVPSKANDLLVANPVN